MRLSRIRLKRMVGLALTVGLAVVVTGCSQPAYRFIGSDDRDFVLRVPHTWTPLNTSDVLKAGGLDPATQVAWTAFYDASAKPGVDHLQTPTAADPVLVVARIPLTKDQRASITGDQLREAILPLTPELRPQALAAHVFRVLENQTVAAKNENGARIRYSYVVGGVPEIWDRIALIDPKLTAVHVITVHCTQACYTAHQAEITDVVTSLTLKTP